MKLQIYKSFVTADSIFANFEKVTGLEAGTAANNL